jgi:hypothetical protein
MTPARYGKEAMMTWKCPIRGRRIFCSAAYGGKCSHGFTVIDRDGTCKKRRKAK